MVIVGAIALMAFVLPFLTKRRFGVSGLALAAGSMLAALWVGDITPFVAKAGVVIVQPPLESVVTLVLTLLPAILLLFSSPKASSSLQRVGGSIIFAALAIALLTPALESALVVDASGKTLHDFLVTNRAAIVTVGLVAAVLDILFRMKPKTSGHSSGHGH
ncbi:MAG TPA: hypothetical protein VJ841_00655 [Candidatus Saccharimonadales bacterium]|nr:hypothetical protein [Candidatus Saccharimonadales bacterium]